MQFTSPILASASGKVAGLVASRNRAGQYFRAHVIPVNPNTQYQESMRTYLAQLSVAFQTDLTDAQRSAWATYAANVAMVGRLGQTIYLTAQNHFVRSNAPRLQAGLARIDDGPTEFNLGAFEEPSIGPDVAGQEFNVTFEDTEAWCSDVGAALLFWASRPKNPTIGFFNGPYRFAGAVLGAAVPPTSPEAIATPHAFVAGQRLFGRFSLTQADGRLSYDVRVTGIAA